MALRKRLMATGISAESAGQICGAGGALQTALGTNQATAFPLVDSLNLFGTVAAGTGALLPNNLSPGESMVVVNRGANALLVYPPGTGQINQAGASTAFSLPATKVAEFICTLAGSDFATIVSA